MRFLSKWMIKRLLTFQLALRLALRLAGSLLPYTFVLTGVGGGFVTDVLEEISEDSNSEKKCKR
jgi:uncharacterized membrane protein YeiH